MTKQLTLAQAAAELGVTAATLRQQVANGRFAATKLGPIWVTTDDEVTRYASEQKGNVGRPRHVPGKWRKKNG